MVVVAVGVCFPASAPHREAHLLFGSNPQVKEQGGEEVSPRVPSSCAF